MRQAGGMAGLAWHHGRGLGPSTAGVSRGGGGWLLIIMAGNRGRARHHQQLSEALLCFSAQLLLAWRGEGLGKRLVGDAFRCHFLLGGDLIFTSLLYDHVLNLRV